MIISGNLIKGNIYGTLAVYMLLGYQPGLFCHALLMGDRESAKAYAPEIIRHMGADTPVNEYITFIDENFPEWLRGDADAIDSWTGVMQASDGVRIQMRLEYGRDPWFMWHVNEQWIDHIWDPKNVPRPTFGKMFADYPRFPK